MKAKATGAGTRQRPRVIPQLHKNVFEDFFRGGAVTENPHQQTQHHGRLLIVKFPQRFRVMFGDACELFLWNFILLHDELEQPKSRGKRPRGVHGLILPQETA